MVIFPAYWLPGWASILVTFWTLSRKLWGAVGGRVGQAINCPRFFLRYSSANRCFSWAFRVFVRNECSSGKAREAEPSASLGFDRKTGPAHHPRCDSSSCETRRQGPTSS